MATELQNETFEELFRAKAENLYEAHGLCCSQAIMLMLNQGLGGGLAEEAVVNLGAGFCGGMGDAGCACGAMTGSVMALGLFLGPQQPGGLPKNEFRRVIRLFHDRFQDRFGSACCKILIRDFTENRRQRLRFCKKLTGEAAAMAATLLLETKPVLKARLDCEYLRSRDSKVSVLLTRLL